MRTVVVMNGYPGRETPTAVLVDPADVQAAFDEGVARMGLGRSHPRVVAARASMLAIARCILISTEGEVLREDDALHIVRDHLIRAGLDESRGAWH